MIIRRDYSTFLPFAIALITLAVFSPALWLGFIGYDDPAYVTQNPQILSDLTIDSIKWAFSSGYESNWLPLTRISQMLDVQLFGLNPSWHHAVNVLLHSISAALLFTFLNTATRRSWLSLGVALLFALHPLRVESVAWISERKDVLCMFFGMLSINAYTRYAMQQSLRWYIAAILMFIMGLMSKPMLVSLPLLLLLLDWWPLGRWNSSPDGFAKLKRNISRILLEKLPFFILAGCSCAITYLVQHSAGTVTQTYTLTGRATRAAISYITYLYKTAWPLELSVIYPFSKYPPSMLTVIAAISFLVIITIISLRLRNNAPYLLTGWLWYLIALTPVIGFIQVGQHSIADRYTYLPHIGLFIMIVWGSDALAAYRWNGSKILTGIFVVALIACTATTVFQLGHWKNSITLFSRALAVTENNWIAHTNLGMEFLDKKDHDQAISHFREAIKAKASYVPAYLNMAYAFREKGDLPSALEAFKSATYIEPANPKGHLGEGLLYVELGERDEAIRKYYMLQRLNPEYSNALRRAIDEGFIRSP